MVKGVLDRKVKLRIVIWDVPRYSLDYINYAAMEEVKNGCFASTKYESGMCVFRNPHVVVFANAPPDYAKMSKDRWCVFRIEGHIMLPESPPGAKARADIMAAPFDSLFD